MNEQGLFYWFCWYICNYSITNGALFSSLVVYDLCSETKGSRFDSGWWLCAEVISQQQSLGLLCKCLLTKCLSVSCLSVPPASPAVQWITNVRKRKPRKEKNIIKWYDTQVFCRKAFIKNFTKSTGKHLCHGLFLTKLISCKY